MRNIIVAFPKMEQAKSIKHILAKRGIEVTGVCTSGAQTLLQANDLGEGIVICGWHLPDMKYQELHQSLPKQFQMLLLASPQVLSQRVTEGIVCLSMPLKVHELLHTVEMMENHMARERKRRKSSPRQRSQQEQEMILQAKRLLMDRNSMTEEEAHRYLQKRSMENGIGLAETAQMVLSIL